MGFIEEAKELLEKELSFKKRKSGFELVNSKNLARLKKEFKKMHDAAYEIQEIFSSLEEKEAPEAKNKASKRKVAFGLGSDEKKKKCSKKALDEEEREKRNAYQREYMRKKHGYKARDKKKAEKKPEKKLTPSERMKAYWKKRKAGELPEQTEAEEEEDDEEESEEEPEENDAIIDDRIKVKLQENVDRLSKLQEKVQGEIKGALSFNAQKVLTAIKQGVEKRQAIQDKSGVPFGSMTGALKELEGRGLIKKAEYETYVLIEKSDDIDSKERD